MKNIFKSAALFFACWIFTNTASAQLASDAPSPATRIQPAVPEIKAVTLPTASAAQASPVKNTTKVAAKKPAVNPVESQGKEMTIKLASDTLTVLPQVSFQTSPAKKSE